MIGQFLIIKHDNREQKHTQTPTGQMEKHGQVTSLVVVVVVVTSKLTMSIILSVCLSVANFDA